MYSGAGHKSTPVFILTEEQSRRVGQNSCLLDATIWKGNRHEEGKLPSHCLQQWFKKNPFKCGYLYKNPLPSYYPIKSTGEAICCAYCCSTGHQCSCTAGLGPRYPLSAGTWLPTTGRLAIFGADPYKGAHQSRQVKLQCCKRNQDLAQSFFALSFILEGSKEANPPKQKTSQGHIHYKQAPAWGSSEGDL